MKYGDFKRGSSVTLSNEGDITYNRPVMFRIKSACNGKQGQNVHFICKSSFSKNLTEHHTFAAMASAAGKNKFLFPGF